MAVARKLAKSDHDGHRIIGWREMISLPDWQVGRIRAKTDTGARISALDVIDVEKLPGRRVRFHVATRRSNRERRIAVVARIVRETLIRSSHGQSAHRYVVRTRMRIGPVVREADISLVCRKHMLCRALIGRQVLGHDLLVDASRRYVLSKPPKSYLKKAQR